MGAGSTPKLKLGPQNYFPGAGDVESAYWDFLLVLIELRNIKQEHKNMYEVQTTDKISILNIIFKQDAQLSQRDCAAGCVTVFAKSRKMELGDNILQTL